MSNIFLHQSSARKKLRKSEKSCWKAGLIDRIRTGETLSKKMNGTQKQLTFRKTAACPTSTTLLSFRAQKLSPMMFTVVKQHLETCEFCSAELALLARHERKKPRSLKPPAIPDNLKILAESILGEPKKTRV